MRNLPFVIWMLGYNALNSAYPPPYEEMTAVVALVTGISHIAAWGIVGYLLYEKASTAQGANA